MKQEKKKRRSECRAFFRYYDRLRITQAKKQQKDEAIAYLGTLGLAGSLHYGRGAPVGEDGVQDSVVDVVIKRRVHRGQLHADHQRVLPGVRLEQAKAGRHRARRFDTKKNEVTKPTQKKPGRPFSRRHARILGRSQATTKAGRRQPNMAMTSPNKMGLLSRTACLHTTR